MSFIMYKGFKIEAVEPKPGSYLHSMNIKAIIWPSDDARDNDHYTSMEYAKQAVDNITDYNTGKLVDYSGYRIRTVGDTYQVEDGNDVVSTATTLQEAKEYIDKAMEAMFS